jgi:manganese transport protein
MGVLGAVVMPHNLFLHSEVIQSRQWNLKDDATIRRQLKYEFVDTSFSMIVGWAINSAIIIVAASTFYSKSIQVSEISQAQQMLRPILGNAASVVFAFALLFSAISSIMTAGMTGGSIFAGFYREPYNIKDPHTKTGILVTLIAAMLVVFLVRDPFKGLIYSQILLSMQLPFTVFLQIYLTSSQKVMGKYANTWMNKTALILIGLVVTILNIVLLVSIFK